MLHTVFHIGISGVHWVLTADVDFYVLSQGVRFRPLYSYISVLAASKQSDRSHQNFLLGLASVAGFYVCLFVFCLNQSLLWWLQKDEFLTVACLPFGTSHSLQVRPFFPHLLIHYLVGTLDLCILFGFWWGWPPKQCSETGVHSRQHCQLTRGSVLSQGPPELPRTVPRTSQHCSGGSWLTFQRLVIHKCPYLFWCSDYTRVDWLQSSIKMTSWATEIAQCSVGDPAPVPGPGNLDSARSALHHVLKHHVDFLKCFPFSNILGVSCT